jgi:signal transduction histidine kinase
LLKELFFICFLGLGISYLSSQNNQTLVLLEKATEERLAGSFDHALQFDLYALNLAKADHNDSLIALAYSGIATDYYRYGDFDEARKYYDLALGIFIEIKDTLNIGDQYYKLGILDVDEVKIQSANENFEKAENIFLFINDYRGLANVYNGMANVCYIQSQFDSVQIFAEQSMKYYRLLNDVEAESFMLINLGALKNALGLHQEALLLVNKGLKIAEENDLINQLRQGYKSLSETYAMLGNWKEAYEYHLAFTEYNDSIFSQQKEQSLRDAEVKYHTVEKEKQLQQQEIQLLSQEKDIANFKNIRNALVLLLLFIGMAAIFFVYRYRSRKKYLDLLDAQNKQLEDINQFKDNVFGIISHDLRSPISALSRMGEALSMSVDQLSPDEIKKYLQGIEKTAEGLHQMLKGLLSWYLSQRGGLNLKYENIHVSKIMSAAINDCRSETLEKNISFKLSLMDEIPVFVDKNLMQIVFRNIISNAVKFSPENGVITISSNIIEKYMHVLIIDKGIGISDEIAQNAFKSVLPANFNVSGTGFGLFLSSELMKKLNGKIKIEDTNKNGTCIKISIPIVEYK